MTPSGRLGKLLGRRPARAPAFDLATLARYDGLALHVRRGMGDRPGDRRFPGHRDSAGVEIEAYVPYTPGDDLRHLDWNAVGRLDALLVRRFTAERAVCVDLLLDASASMTVPPGDDKLGAARELALALAFVALGTNDAVRVSLLGGDGTTRTSPVHRQRASIARIAELLETTAAAGALTLGDALAAHARRHPLPGAAIVVSDLMAEPAEIERGVQALRARRYDVTLLHVLGRSEIDPGRMAGHAVLEDVESRVQHPIRLTADALGRYRAALTTHLAALEALAVRNGAAYARLVTDEGVGAFVTHELPRLGILRRR
jgi:uncharacterized protein (DUF58 family)